MHYPEKSDPIAQVLTKYLLSNEDCTVQLLNRYLQNTWRKMIQGCWGVAQSPLSNLSSSGKGSDKHHQNQQLK